jgi:Cu/Ag efflux protein CusF
MQRSRLTGGLVLAVSVCLWIVAVPGLQAGEGLRPYETEGTVMAVMPDQGMIVIDHGPIEAPGYFMGKMEMPFSVTDPALLNGLKKGDRIRFRVSEEKKSRILELHKVAK